MIKMKDSDIEWIGQIPENWNVDRIKKVLNERKEKNDPIKTEYILSLTNDRGVIPYSEKGAIGNNSKEDLTGYKLAYPNDIVLNSMNVVIGSVGISNYFGAVSPVYYMLNLRNQNDSIAYYNYIFQTLEFQKYLKGFGNGILDIRMRIPMINLNSVNIPIPPNETQKKIVKVLDKKCSQIDELIELQEKEIEKIKEYKQSVITEVVTKGLNPQARMKDSGESFGNIPNSWSVVKFKNLAVLCNGKEIETDGGNIPVYGSGGIFKYTDKYLFSGESVLLGRKGTIDNPMFVDGKFWTVDTMFYTSSFKNIIGKYLFYLCKGIIDYGFYKSGSVLPSMTQTEINNISFPYTNIDEQKKIVKYLDAKILLLEQLVAIKYEKILKLYEYKKSLIYEYITGKKECK